MVKSTRDDCTDDWPVGACIQHKVNGKCDARRWINALFVLSCRKSCGQCKAQEPKADVLPMFNCQDNWTFRQCKIQRDNGRCNFGKPGLFKLNLPIISNCRKTCGVCIKGSISSDTIRETCKDRLPGSLCFDTLRILQGRENRNVCDPSKSENWPVITSCPRTCNLCTKNGKCK